MTQERDVEKISAEVRGKGRRRFLRDMLFFAAALALPPGRRRAFAFAPKGGTGTYGTGKEFVFAQVAYDGGTWDPEPGAAESLIRELEGTTSVDAYPRRVVVRLESPDLFSYPFLYLAGASGFSPFGEENVERLGKFLRSGGTLLCDDCGGTPGYGFDAAIRREMARVCPDAPFRRLPADHTVFRSFFLVRGVGGRRIVSPFLEGIQIGVRTPVIYSPNGLAGAWSTDADGRWSHTVEPGGERQRRLAFQIAINAILYALCADYKQDRIHLPFLRKKI